MAAPPSSPNLEFGPRRAPIWIARIFGLIAAAGAAGVLVAAGLVGRQTPGLVAFLAVFGLAWSVFGAWMLFAASRMSKFRAVLTPASLRLVAAHGHSVWFQGSVIEINSVWADVQGFSRVDMPNPSAPGGVQSTYILYTKGGDVSLNSVQWENLEELMREIGRRSGHPAGEVAPEKSAAQNEVRVSERRMRSFQRIAGWIVLISSAALLLPVIVASLATGFSTDLAKAVLFLIFAMTLAASLIRFYRHR